jgi:hypothetical protein
MTTCQYDRRFEDFRHDGIFYDLNDAVFVSNKCHFGLMNSFFHDLIGASGRTGFIIFFLARPLRMQSPVHELMDDTK